ncbi:type IV pilus modification protein PilV [Ideonella sp.]|uniref:type IV pilus modification protein PilV n=1 Tax=Ideonella sp. TaxID=1929293 RepID=UPI0035AFF804
MDRLTPGRRQRGVSLIEVLVAMLIVSLGVLAMAGLLATASRYGRTSEFRAVATLLANDMADRIRANKAALDDRLAGGALTNYDMTGGYDTWADEPADPAACDIATECRVDEIAAQDRAAWAHAVFTGLPGGAGFVSVSEPLAAVGADSRRNFTADIWVAWLDPDADDDQPVAENECPEAFRGQTPQPRCAFFRVGL